MNRPQPKFNIGDRVRVIENAVVDRYTHEGGEYIIENIVWREFFNDFIYGLNNKSPIRYKESDLELVEFKSFIPTPKNKPPMPPVEPPKSVIKSTKSPTLSEVVDLIKEMRTIMTIQGRNGDDITRMAHNICKQYGYDLPESIVK